MKKFLFLLILFWLTNFHLLAQLLITDTITSPPCLIADSGAINITVSGGTEPYSYAWYSDNQLISNQEDISGLNAGVFTVIVTDATEKSTSRTLFLSSTNSFTTVDTLFDIQCNGKTTQQNITPVNGIGLYTGFWKKLKWDVGQNLELINSDWADTSYTYPDTLNFLESLYAGTYYLTILDSRGPTCAITKEITLTEPEAPLSLSESHTDIICKHDSTGTINLQVEGGTPSYFFSWSNDQSAQNLISLSTGIYVVTVSDTNACTLVQSIDIDEPFQDIIFDTDLFDVSCRDNQDGHVIIKEVENAHEPYTYSWSTASATNQITDLLDGTYSLTFTDANNCERIDTFLIGKNDIDCITIFNVITPDGNGKNDTWNIKNIHLYPDCNILVLDRWGKSVYSFSGAYNNDWDGMLNGDQLSSGDYYYIINLNKGNYPAYTGPLKIIK